MICKLSVLRIRHEGGKMRKADIVVALGLMLVGLLVIADSIRLGFGWGISGPESGFFPFYMGLGTVVCTFFIALRGIRTYKKEGPGKPLVEEGGMTQILWVLLPAIGMILLTELIGLHLATVLYLAFYMGVVGKIRWSKVIVLSILVPLAIYILFDRIFLIPLPEGLWGKNIMALIP
jgi:putative tricarboxylic transport membrane protein